MWVVWENDNELLINHYILFAPAYAVKRMGRGFLISKREQWYQTI